MNYVLCIPKLPHYWPECRTGNYPAYIISYFRAAINISGSLRTWKDKKVLLKLVLEKAEEPEIKLPTSTGSWKKQESSRKTSISTLLTMPKPLTVLITINCGQFWKRWKYQTTLPASWETYMQVRRQQLELDMESTDWFLIGKVVFQGCILSSCLFNLYAEYIMRNSGLDESQTVIKIAMWKIS